MYLEPVDAAKLKSKHPRRGPFQGGSAVTRIRGRGGQLVRRAIPRQTEEPGAVIAADHVPQE